jgi:hypothetical protein
MVAGCRDGCAAWAESRRRLAPRRGLGHAVARSDASAARSGAHRRGAHGIGRASGWYCGVGPEHGPHIAPGTGGRLACRRSDCSPVRPLAQGGERAGGVCRSDTLVFHDVHRTRRWLDAGANAGSALCGGWIGSGDKWIRAVDVGTRRRRPSHCGDARRHRPGRYGHLPRLGYRCPLAWFSWQDSPPALRSRRRLICRCEVKECNSASVLTAVLCGMFFHHLTRHLRRTGRFTVVVPGLMG